MQVLSSKSESIAIIIVTHNSFSFLEPLMKSLLLEVKDRDTTICCIDNHSTDQTLNELQRLQNEWGIPHLFHGLSENIGLPSANNFGIRHVEKNRPHSTFVFLNPDTVVLSGWLDAICSALADPKVGSVQSLALLPDGTINTRGGGIHYLGFGYTTGLYENVSLNYPTPNEIAYSSGVSMAISRKILLELENLEGKGKVFWNLLFLYGEDVELGWRLSLLGYEHRLAPQSRVVHHYDFFTKRNHDLQFFYMERNRWLILFALYRIPTLILLSPFLLISEIGLRVRYNQLMKIKPLHLYREIFNILQKKEFWIHRSLIQKKRVVTDRKILKRKDSKITHPGVERWSQKNNNLPGKCGKKIEHWIEHGLALALWLLRRLVRW